MGTKTILILSDLHCGSAYGVMPPDFVLSTGAKCNQNKGQEYLWKCWTHALGQLPARVDALILNGDLCEGNAIKDEGRGLSEIDPGFQVRAAVQLLKPLAKRCKQVWATRGSQYHIGIGGGYEEAVAEGLGAQSFNGWKATPWLRIELGGLLFDIGHRQSVTIAYRSMPMEREIRFSLESAARRNERAPDVIVRSHAHYGYAMWEDGQRYAISTPPFKLMDAYILGSISPNRAMPWSLGMVLLRINDKEEQGHKLRTWPLLYDHPPLTRDGRMEVTHIAKETTATRQALP